MQLVLGNFVSQKTLKVWTGLYEVPKAASI